MSRWQLHAAILMMVGALCTVPASAASLKVGPARFTIQDVKPGLAYDLLKDAGVQLTVYNDDSVERAWNLTVNRPSARGSWERGYSEIPDASWCRLEPAMLSVPAGGRSSAKLFLQIPDDERYCNQHWAVTIGIDGASGRPGIALAADVRVLIETTAKTGVAAPPDGPLGLAPAKVSFDSAVPGVKSTADVRLYNNTSESRRYVLGSLLVGVPDTSAYLTAGFARLAHPESLHYPAEVTVTPGGSAVLCLELVLPEGSTPEGKKWEELVLVSPDEGRPAFIRVQVLAKTRDNKP